MKQVRLYGHQLGYTSFSQVTRGFGLSLGHIGAFGGFVPLDFFDEEVDYPGSTCPVSVNAGMPSGVARAKLLGIHEERWLMLAPNSDRIPQRMIEWLPELVTALLTPSTWAARVLRALMPKLPVHVVPHGVHREYAPLPRHVRIARAMELEEIGRFRVLHMTSTNSERKGTKQLLEAWRTFERHPEQRNHLTIVCRTEGYEEMMADAKRLGLVSVDVLALDGVPYDRVLSLFGQAHVVCQPSRAEGFGLVPLEAKACGVPVVMTACTGHADHVSLGATVTVPTGPYVPIDDMEGATAPSLDALSVYEALCAARRNYQGLDELARARAPMIREAHSWENTTGSAMRKLLQ